MKVKSNNKDPGDIIIIIIILYIKRSSKALLAMVRALVGLELVNFFFGRKNNERRRRRRGRFYNSVGFCG